MGSCVLCAFRVERFVVVCSYNLLVAFCSIASPDIADDDLNRPDVSAAGFAHPDTADLFGDVVLGAYNFE